MKELSALEIKSLKSRAHHLKPVVMVGQKGITDSLIDAMEKALDDHELIKIKFIDYKEEKKELAPLLAEKTASSLVALIGNVAIFYREKEEKEEE